MPKSKAEKVERKGIRLPKPMVDEIDKLVKKYPSLCPNRQQFIETAIREKIEKIIKLVASPQISDELPQKQNLQ